MMDAPAPRPPALVTTSWDDGHPLDLRLATLLHTHGLVGTFYVPLSCGARPVLTASQVRTLRHLGMEVGSHTVSHRVLTSLAPAQAATELRDSKTALEQILGEPVTAFCYPKGRWNRTVRTLAAEAGYTVARTTMAFHTTRRVDPLLMPVSVQVFPHCRSVHLRHALKEGNLHGLAQWSRYWHRSTDPLTLVALMLDHIQHHGGICHIWGHTWEIAQHGLWPLLEAMLRCLASRPGVQYVTNTQAAQYYQRAKS